MAGIFGGGSKPQTQATAASGVQLQSSAQGMPLPLVFGTNSIAPNLIWYGNFIATAHQSSSGSGGKGAGGGGGGKGGGGSVSYTYQAALEFALCAGPIQGIGNVYVSKQVTSLAALGYSLYTGTSMQAPWSYLVQQNTPVTESHTIPSSGPYTVTLSGAANYYQDGGAAIGTAVAFTNVTPNAPAASGQYTVSYGPVRSLSYNFYASDIGTNVLITQLNENTGAPITVPATIPANAYLQIQTWSDYYPTDGGITTTGGALVVSGSPTPPAGQYYAAQGGTYTFNAAQAGQTVTITYYSYQGTQALSYNYTAYIANAAYQMGNTPQIPNHNVEVMGLFSNSVSQEIYGEAWYLPADPTQGVVNSFGGSSSIVGGRPTIAVNYNANWTSDAGVVDTNGNIYTKVGGSPTNLQYSQSGGVYTFSSIQGGATVYITYSASVGADADPSLVLNYLLTDPRQGVLFPSANLGSLSVWQAYCIANGLLISPAYTQQNSASSMITDIMTATNSDIVSSGGVVTVVPYGDQSITANGYTYTAPSAPLYSLTDDDFITTKNQDPVQITRANPADVYNSINLTCLDRANQYNATVINAKNQAAIDTLGLRETQVDMRIFANVNAARYSTQLQLHRQEVRNEYAFTLDHRYLLLDPMDIVAITDTYLGLNAQWVRILSITEDDSGNFAITAEEYMTGNASAPVYNFQRGVGYNVNYDFTPGNANVPVIFEPPVQIAQTGGLEVDIATSGGANWGGCDVWISTDGSTYKNAGRVEGNARQGTLVNTLASGSDPDTTNVLKVTLAQSRGQIAGGTQNDADNFHTLCYVGGELVSYETVQLAAAYTYNISYLRRGVYGSSVASHAAGAQFARLDAGIFAYAYDKSKIGQTIYIKLLGYNIYKGGQQALADVTPYTYLIKGPPLPGTVQNFGGQQSGNVVVFTWDDLPYDVGLKGYDIAYGVIGSTWANKILLTEAARGTEMTNAAVPPGVWEFAIRGHDIADNLSPTAATFSLTVTNTDQVIAEVMQEPSWPGTLSNFVLHYTGVLTPAGSKTVDQYSAISAPTAPTLGSVVGGALGLTTYYVKITYIDATGETVASTEASKLVAALSLLTVSSPAPSGLATGWNVYVSTSTGTETLQNAAPIQIGASWTEPATGLISGAALPTANSTGWQVFNQFVPDPVTSASYIAPTIDAMLDGNVRVYSTIGYGLGFGNTGTPNLGLAIDTWLTAGSDSGVFIPWNIGYTNMRYLRAELLYSTIIQGQVGYITDFMPIIDTAPTIENSSAGGVVVSAGGTAITFPTPYHLIPNVVATVISAGTGLYASVSAVSTTGCTLHVWNTSGTDVGGTVNWQSTGE